MANINNNEYNIMFLPKVSNNKNVFMVLLFYFVILFCVFGWFFKIIKFTYFKFKDVFVFYIKEITGKL